MVTELETLNHCSGEIQSCVPEPLTTIAASINQHTVSHFRTLDDGTLALHLGAILNSEITHKKHNSVTNVALNRPQDLKDTR